MALASPAQASGGLFCEGEGGWVDIAMGRTYSTGPERGEGEPFMVGQAFSEGDEIMVDFVDTNFERILISLRVTWDSAEEIYKGVLFTPTTSVDVSCMEG
jgi:hypothetical protein